MGKNRYYDRQEKQPSLEEDAKRIFVLLGQTGTSLNEFDFRRGSDDPCALKKAVEDYGKHILGISDEFKEFKEKSIEKKIRFMDLEDVVDSHMQQKLIIQDLINFLYLAWPKCAEIKRPKDKIKSVFDNFYNIDHKTASQIIESIRILRDIYDSLHGQRLEKEFLTQAQVLGAKLVKYTIANSDSIGELSPVIEKADFVILSEVFHKYHQECSKAVILSVPEEES